jgi:hypothetical protein
LSDDTTRAAATSGRRFFIPERVWNTPEAGINYPAAFDGNAASSLYINYLYRAGLAYVLSGL